MTTNTAIPTVVPAGPPVDGANPNVLTLLHAASISTGTREQA